MRYLLFILVVVSLAACADINRAKQYYYAGESKKAARDFEGLADKGYPEALYFMGKLIATGQLKNRKPQDAVEYFKKAYRLGFLKAAWDIGMFYLRHNQPQKARVWFLKAATGIYGVRIKADTAYTALLKLANENPAVYLVIANAYKNGWFGKVNLRLAEKYYRLAYKAGIDEAGFGLASVYASTGRYKEAIKILEALFTRGYRRAAYRLGRIYEKLAKRAYIGRCDALVAKTPFEYYRLKAKKRKLYTSMIEKALFWYRKAGDLPNAKYRIARIEWNDTVCDHYSDIKRYASMGSSDAQKDIERIISGQMCPGLATILNLPRKRSYGGFEQLKRAYYTFQTSHMRSYGNVIRTLAKRLHPDNNTAALVLLGRLYLNGIGVEQNRRKAFEYFKRACELGSATGEIEVAGFLKNRDLAASVYYFYAKKGVADAMEKIAEIYLSLKAKKKGLDWMIKAALLGNVKASKYMVDYYLRKGRTQDAVMLLKTLIKKGYCFGYVMMGSLYDSGLLKPDIKKALKYYTEALNQKCEIAYLYLARVYLYGGKGIGDPRKAIKMIKTYLSYNNTDPIAYHLLALSYLRLGDKEKTRKYLMKAAQLGYLLSWAEIKIVGYKNLRILARTLKGRYLLAMAKITESSDLKASLCYAYWAAVKKAPGAALKFLSLTNRANSAALVLFVKELAEDPYICRVYLNALKR